MGVDIPGSPAYTAISSLSGVARSVLRSPAVVITLESSGMVQAMTTAVTMPSAMNRSKNHVRRSRQAANVTTVHIDDLLMGYRPDGLGVPAELCGIGGICLRVNEQG